MTPDELRARRAALGLTQTQMSERLQTPFRTYQDWEGGRRRIPGVLIVALRCLEKQPQAERELKP